MIRKTSLLALVLFLLAGYASAGGVYRKVEVYLDRIGLVLSGQQTGSIDSIVYNGTVYLPIRKIGEALGGNVTWDPARRAVDIDFVDSQGELVAAATQQTTYQYLLLEKNRIMKDMVAQIQKNDYTAMKGSIERLKLLEKYCDDFEDASAKDYFAKMAYAGEVLRSGLESKNGGDYKLAMQLFLDSESKVTEYLANKIKSLETDISSFSSAAIAN